MSNLKLVGSVLSVAVIIICGFILFSHHSQSSNLTTTAGSTSTTIAPLQSAAFTNSSNSYVYCIGGSGNPANSTFYTTANSTYYTNISSAGGIGTTWYQTAPYPIDVNSEQCVADNNSIYCVGGTSTITGKTTNKTYVAQLSSSGISDWQAGSDYPIGISSWPSCVLSGGYIYCTGGFGRSSFSNLTYYAPVSSSGIGSWQQTTSYPTSDGPSQSSCTSYNGYMYCTGEAGSSYYAPLSSSGVGQWQPAGNSGSTYSAYMCTGSGSGIYCITRDPQFGLDAYAGTLSPAGINWSDEGFYPAHVSPDSCFTSNGYVYCLGNAGVSSSYYAEENSILPNTVILWSPTSSYASGKSADVCVTSKQ